MSLLVWYLEGAFFQHLCIVLGNSKLVLGCDFFCKLNPWLLFFQSLFPVCLARRWKKQPWNGLLHLLYINDGHNLFNELLLHLIRKGADSGHKKTQSHKKTCSHLQRTWILTSSTLKNLYSVLEVYLLYLLSLSSQTVQNQISCPSFSTASPQVRLL